MTAAFYWDFNQTRPQEHGGWRSHHKGLIFYMYYIYNSLKEFLIEGASLCNARESGLLAHSARRNERKGELEENGAQAAEGQDCPAHSGAPAAFPLCSAMLWQRSRLLMEERRSGALLQLQGKVRVWLPPQLHAKSSFSQRSGLGWQLHLWTKSDQPVQHIHMETSLLATHQVRKNKIICGLASKINSQFSSVLRYE